MHAADVPGSHIIIQCSDVPKETLVDAAALAAKHSKAKNCKVAVSLTKCKNVSKPKGAKPGLVILSGEIKTIKVNTGLEKARILALEE
jgi:predicted ribosome quality control (RQC) complex YloA/Tae2 family protein